MSDITISSAVRSNLSALQSTSKLISGVQEKLATGKRVNSALDNPNSFFTASGLNNRANDLSNLLDDMGQGVQTLKAADNGIGAISDLVDAAKAKANQALQTTSQTLKSQYADEYNELLTQIEDIAKDAGYKGKNLLGGSGNDLNVQFNENGTSDLDITAVDFTDTALTGGLNLSDLAQGASGTFTIDGTSGNSLGAGLTSGGTFTTGDVITLTDDNGREYGTFTVSSSSTIGDLVTFLDDVDGVSAAASSLAADDGQIDVTSKFKLNITTFEDDGTTAVTAATGSGGTASGFSTDAQINAELDKLKIAQDTLRAQASTFGTNLSIVQNRQDFTTSLINTLEEGAGLLTLADTNEEGANLLALQTQQSLASTSLSLAAQADQNVLRLF